MKTTFLLTVAVVLAISLGVSACGSSSSTSTEGASAGQQAAPKSPPSGSPETSKGGSKEAGSRSGPAAGSRGQGAESPPSEPRFNPPHHHDSAGGSEQFVQKGGDNSVQEYGSEQTAGSEFAEAAATLHVYLDARAAGAWGAACGALAAGLVEQLVEQLEGSGSKTACPEVLAAFNSSFPSAALREAAEVNVAALRVEGDKGFLLFKGAHDEPFFIPMRREGGDWKVAAVGPSSLP